MGTSTKKAKIHILSTWEITPTLLLVLLAYTSAAKPPVEFTKEDVRNFLTSTFGSGTKGALITEKFEEHDIDGSFLVTMNKADLLEVGMSKLEARKFAIALKKILPIDDAIDSRSSSSDNNADGEKNENKKANSADDEKKEQEAPSVPSDEDKVDEVKKTKENSKVSESIEEEKIKEEETKENTKANTANDEKKEQEAPSVPSDEDKVDEVKGMKENSKDSESIKEEKIKEKDVKDATNKEKTSAALEKIDVQDGDKVGDVKNPKVDNK